MNSPLQKIIIGFEAPDHSKFAFYLDVSSGVRLAVGGLS
jgi:hypothetical protein